MTLTVLLMRKPSHFLKSYRRYTGFSQADVARLIGIATHWSVSRHERRRRPVTLQTALAYEVIYRRPVADIFGGMHALIRSTIIRRAKALLDNLPPTGNPVRDGQRKQSLHAILLVHDGSR